MQTKQPFRLGINGEHERVSFDASSKIKPLFFKLEVPQYIQINLSPINRIQLNVSISV